MARSYAYDKLYRLRTETLSGDAEIAGTIGYQYDRVGNRLHRTSTLPQLPPQTQIVDANDRLTDRPFDANGNTIETTGTLPGERLFDSYDSEDRLTRRESSVAGVLAEYRYDGDGNRTEERTPAGTIRFLVDTQNHTGYAQVLEEKSPSGNLLRSYAYGLDLIAQHDSTSTHYFGYDGLGTTRLLTDVDGNVSDRFWYDAFGTLLKREGTTDTRYLYTGEQYDAALGMYYLRARYLEAGTGRFWTRDRFEGEKTTLDDVHGYSYVAGNPTSYFDHSGNAKLKDISITQLLQNLLRKVKDGRQLQSSRRAIKKLLCVGARHVILLETQKHQHHPIPKFMGGFPDFDDGGAPGTQTPHPIRPRAHSRFHSFLNALLKLEGEKLEGLGGYDSWDDWEDLFQRDPSARDRAHAVLKEAAKIYDKICKPRQRLYPIVYRMLREGRHY